MKNNSANCINKGDSTLVDGENFVVMIDLEKEFKEYIKLHKKNKNNSLKMINWEDSMKKKLEQQNKRQLINLLMEAEDKYENGKNYEDGYISLYANLMGPTLIATISTLPSIFVSWIIVIMNYATEASDVVKEKGMQITFLNETFQGVSGLFSTVIIGWIIFFFLIVSLNSCICWIKDINCRRRSYRMIFLKRMIKLIKKELKRRKK